MKSVILIQGGDSYSKREDFLEALRTQEVRDPYGPRFTERWSDRLGAAIGEEFEFMIPAMPNHANAQFDEWSIWFERYLEIAQHELILVGWSLGGMFLSKYLIENDLEPQSLFILGAPCGTYDDGTGNDCGSFQFDSKQLGKLTERTNDIHIFHSEDDFLVDFSHAEQFMAELPEATLHAYTDQNHFLVPEVPDLVAAIKDRA